MKNIEIKKFIAIVSSIVLGFCIIAGVILWIIINNQTGKVITPANANKGNINEADTINNAGNENVVSGIDTAQIVNNVQDNEQVQGSINVKNINTMVQVNKYSLLTNGSYDSKKINKFLNKNIEQFYPVECTKVEYKLADIDNDGIDEAAMMYEKSNQSDRYLMISVLRWKDKGFCKDVDTELKKNDYNFGTNEIVVGDIITGGNPEFIFIQKDPKGLKTSRAKIIILLNRGFSDFYTVDSPCELEVEDYDSDGKYELYTSLITGDSNKHMSWKKWDGKDFLEYDSRIEPISSETGENTY